MQNAKYCKMPTTAMYSSIDAGSVLNNVIIFIHSHKRFWKKHFTTIQVHIYSHFYYT